MELLLSGEGRLTEQLSIPLAKLVFSSSRLSENKEQTQSVKS